MEGTWLYIDEDSICDSSFSDSDEVDIETEAQLYSVVHHEENLSSSISGMENVQALKVSAVTSDKGNDVFSMEEKTKNVKAESIGSVMPISQINVKNSVGKRKITSETTFLNKLAQKLNPVKKKKSDSNHKVSNVLCSDSSVNRNFNHTSKDGSLNNKQKKKTDRSSHKKQCLATKNEVVVDSSDSDIWTELDSLPKKDFQTNLCKDDYTINLSSDSEFDILSSSRKRVPDLKNLPMPTIKIGENSKDIWFVSDEDLLYKGRKKKSRRYHDNVEITCTNCNKQGHSSRICTVPKKMKCFICGLNGHSGAQCVNRICSRCYGIGHGSGRCHMPCISYCDLCNMKGHVKENCPDIWRRYHLTTQPGKIIRAKRVKQHKCLSCSNCGGAGHFGAKCKKFQVLKNCLPTWPCVVSYDDPEDLLRNRLNGYSGRCIGFREDTYVNTRTKPCEAGDFIAERRTKKKRNKFNLQNCHEIQKAAREKNFPRTPKSNMPSTFPDEVMPKFVNVLKKQKRREKNRLRRMKRRQQFLLMRDSIVAGNTQFSTDLYK